MLDRFRDKAGKVLHVRLQLPVLVGDRNLVKALGRLFPAQRQAALGCQIWLGPLNDLGIEHHHWQETGVNRDNGLALPDHVGRQARGGRQAIPLYMVVDQGIQEILGNLLVRLGGRGCLAGQE